MIINIHPSAASNYNNKAFELIELIEIFPMAKNQTSFPSDLYVNATITEKDIISDIEVAASDYHGCTVQRFFHLNGQRLGLSEENYKRLRETAERIQSLPSVRSMLSSSFVEKKLFSWVSKKYRGLETPDLFIEYLDKEAKDVVKTTTSWIPIANLEVQTVFPVSKSEIRPLSKATIDQWSTKVLNLAGKNKENVLKQFEKIRKEYQGLAAVVTTITAEPEYAFDYTLKEAQKITAVLGIFSSATLTPDIKCASNIKGSELIAQSTVFFEDEKENFHMTSSIIDKSSAKHWRLGQRDIIKIQKAGLDRISSLLASESLTDFNKSVLNSVFLYSKSAFTADPVEKVVHMLSSLESILLKNENESIQQNLAERIAVFTSHVLPKRKSIIKNIKSVYGIRSRYLHHGYTSSELELISDFMMHVRVFFIQLLAHVDRFDTQAEFVNAIDDHKLS
ncbi:MAG TPA: hypothetical protein DDX29_05820 [Clostridiales bacterium]|nr:hypothetical protein [Clostridiales bacterium]